MLGISLRTYLHRTAFLCWHDGGSAKRDTYRYLRCSSPHESQRGPAILRIFSIHNRLKSWYFLTDQLQAAVALATLVLLSLYSTPILRVFPEKSSCFSYVDRILCLATLVSEVHLCETVRRYRRIYFRRDDCYAIFEADPAKSQMATTLWTYSGDTSGRFHTHTGHCPSTLESARRAVCIYLDVRSEFHPEEARSFWATKQPEVKHQGVVWVGEFYVDPYWECDGILAPSV